MLKCVFNLIKFSRFGGALSKLCLTNVWITRDRPSAFGDSVQCVQYSQVKVNRYLFINDLNLSNPFLPSLCDIS